MYSTIHPVDHFDFATRAATVVIEGWRRKQTQKIHFMLQYAAFLRKASVLRHPNLFSTLLACPNALYDALNVANVPTRAHHACLAPHAKDLKLLLFTDLLHVAYLAMHT